MLRGHRIAACVAALLAAVARVAAQPVQGTVRSVGFQANVPSRFVIRQGQWFPIVLELAAQTGRPIQCRVAVERADLDGDRVQYTEPLVALTPEAGLKKVWCYAVSAREEIGPPMTVEVRDAAGNLLTELSAPPFEVVSNDYMLVVDVSASPAALIGELDADRGEYVSPEWGERRYYRNVCVARLPAADLPDRWFGLEAADVVVWDEPDPDALAAWQLEALAEWVRQGGQLVIGIGPSWPKLRASPLAAILPIRGMSATIEVTDLPQVRARFAASGQAAFRSPVSLAVGTLADGAFATLFERVGARRVPLVSMRPVGSGRVTAVAVRLRDLSELGLNRSFLRELLDVVELTDAYRNNEAGNSSLLTQVIWLYRAVVEGVEFRAQASLRMLAALGFVAAYIGLSTFASWWWLERHRLTHLSWTVFAGFAAVTGTLSLGAVALSRGVLEALHSVSFVDLEAGSTEARGVSWFGYKSSRRQRVDLRLPGEGGYLRPMASGPEPAAAYAAPERYAAVPREALLQDVLMRATVKQFEARWSRVLEGTIHGQLTASRESGRILPESWIRNDLPVPTGLGWLLYIDPRLGGREGVPLRAATLTTRSDRGELLDKPVMPPAVNVLAVSVPALRPGENATELGKAEYLRFDEDYARWNASGASPRNEPPLASLWRWQNQSWVPSLAPQIGWQAGVPAPVAAMMLCSTRDLYLASPAGGDFEQFGTPISTAGLVDVDVTHWLTRGQAVLLLPSETPAPVGLARGQRPMQPQAGRALYRVRIPIRYTGQPPAEERP